jgi:sRNA-binding carbon storage regulator CsrA
MLHILIDIGDTIKIGNDIEIVYTRRVGRRVGISITADKSIKIKKVKQDEPKHGIDGNPNR